MYSHIPTEPTLCIARRMLELQHPPVSLPSPLFAAMDGIRLFPLLADGAVTMRPGMVAVASARFQPPHAVSLGSVLIDTGP